MSELVGPLSPSADPARTALGRWRMRRRAGREAAGRRADEAIGAYTRIVLAASTLYVLIGHSPFTHELVFDPMTGGAITSPVNRYFWMGLFVLAAPILILRLQEAVRVARAAWPLVVIIVWFAATTLWAIDPAAAQRRFFVELIVVLLCIAVRTGLPDGRDFQETFAFTVAGIVVLDLASWILLPAQSMTDIGLAAIHNHKNTLGAVMLLCGVILVPIVVLARRGWRRLPGVALLVAGALLLMASRSKTSEGLALGAALLGPVVMGLLGLRTRLLWSLLVLALAAVAAILFAWIAACGLLGLDPFAPIESLTFTKRVDVWGFVLREVAKHPFTGVGYSSFWDVNPLVQPSLKTDEWFAKPDAPTNEAHNGFLDLLVTTGIPGLVGGVVLLLRWILGAGFLVRRALLDKAPAVRASLPWALTLLTFTLVFVAHNFMESSYFNPESAFGFIILLVGVAVDVDVQVARDRAGAA